MQARQLGVIVSKHVDASYPTGLGPECQGPVNNRVQTEPAPGSQGWLAPSALFEAVAITLRLGGRDLAKFWGGELTREAMRKRVELQEF